MNPLHFVNVEWCLSFRASLLEVILKIVLNTLKRNSESVADRILDLRIELWFDGLEGTETEKVKGVWRQICAVKGVRGKVSFPINSFHLVKEC